MYNLYTDKLKRIMLYSPVEMGISIENQTGPDIPIGINIICAPIRVLCYPSFYQVIVRSRHNTRMSATNMQKYRARVSAKTQVLAYLGNAIRCRTINDLRPHPLGNQDPKTPY